MIFPQSRVPEEISFAPAPKLWYRYRFQSSVKINTEEFVRRMPSYNARNCSLFDVFNIQFTQQWVYLYDFESPLLPLQVIREAMKSALVLQWETDDPEMVFADEEQQKYMLNSLNRTYSIYEFNVSRSDNDEVDEEQPSLQHTKLRLWTAQLPGPSLYNGLANVEASCDSLNVKFASDIAIDTFKEIMRSVPHSRRMLYTLTSTEPMTYTEAQDEF